MRGWRATLTIAAGAVFIVAGAASARALHAEGSLTWSLIFSAIFCGGGTSAVAYGIYAARAGIGYKLEVMDHVILWGRADIPKEAGRINLRDVREIVHTSGPDDESLHAIDLAGIRHPIPLAYMDGARTIPELLKFIRTCYPAIKIRN